MANLPLLHSPVPVSSPEIHNHLASRHVMYFLGLVNIILFVFHSLVLGKVVKFSGK